MDDLRIEWISKQICNYFDIFEMECFEDLLHRNDDVAELSICQFLSDSATDISPILFFTKYTYEEEREYEISIDEVSKESEKNVTSENNESSDINSQKSKKSNEIEEKNGIPKEGVENNENKVDMNETTIGDANIKKTKIITEKIEKVALNMKCFNVKPSNAEKELQDIISNVDNDYIIYIVRTTDKLIQLPSNEDECQDIMPENIEIGLLNTFDLLKIMQPTLSKIYTTFLSYNQHITLETSDLKNASRRASIKFDHKLKTEGIDMQPGGYVIRDEFLLSLQTFCQNVSQTSHQLDGDVKLKDIPEKLIEAKTSIEIIDNNELKSFMIDICENWYNQLNGAVLKFQQVQPSRNGPLAEVEYWKERNFLFSSLYEQLKRTDIDHIFAAYNMYLTRSMSTESEELDNKNDNLKIYKLKSKPSYVQTKFDKLMREISKYYVEANDNVRFLSTLERNFKNVTYSVSFQSVIDTLPSLMNSLRMIWIISRHYNTDDRMIPLMERIAWEILERVTRVITIRNLFDNKPHEIKRKTLEARTTLDSWKSAYMDTRAKIEICGRDSRWEFDRKRLFEKTDFASSICTDLFNIAQILEEFYNIFGPELMSVTGDIKKIEKTLERVNNLVVPIKNVITDI
ncbi:hypothetical protein A3Q56_07866 [Intoshia linei]|uniref:Dynein heavy chain tail domain-containing protein n=1 Tax=Intoshia linei TaxID=1819745 RepID=A0A177AT64_9BILA|nr:hypothetical protein A3Q56_07866 [Intoshia linei]